MLEGFGDGRFALGLIAGIGGTLVAVLLGEQIYDLVQCIAGTECNANSASDKDGDEPEWWYWARRLVAAEDTLAQWVMSLFSIAAVALIWRTLSATRQMVSEAKSTTDAAITAAEQAKRQADLAEGSFRNLESPKLFPKILKNQIIYQGQKPPSDVKYALVNLGRSPAVVVGVCHYFSSRNETGAFQPLYDVIAPGEVSDVKHVVKWEEEGRAFNTPGNIFHVQISYQDGSGARGETAWDFVLTKDRNFILMNR